MNSIALKKTLTVTLEVFLALTILGVIPGFLDVFLQVQGFSEGDSHLYAGNVWFVGFGLVLIIWAYRRGKKRSSSKVAKKRLLKKTPPADT
ncbi:MAG: hypothetical protein ACE5HB_00695 [Terriglobia bacterium]